MTGPGYPEAGTYTVPRCLHAVLDEEWWHRRFAERDLSALLAATCQTTAERCQHQPVAGEVEGEPVAVEVRPIRPGRRG